MKSIILLILNLFILQSLWANPKMSVIVETTDDRWIHFSDGVKLHHGMEVSHLLNQMIYESGKYRLFIKQDNDPSVGLYNKTQGIVEDVEEAKKRLPGTKFDYYKKKEVTRTFSLGDAHIVIRPKVKTLLYASGTGGNRIVYGFSPDRLNPYNEGREGSRENEFVPKSPNLNKCTEIDYFKGQANAYGWGHKRSNFGANADEGIGFKLFGFGFKFRKKEFQVKLGIEFEVSVPHRSFLKTYEYDFKAKGKDILVDASFFGVNLGYESKRRFTMKQAIDESLPKLMAKVLKDLPEFSWETQLMRDSNGVWFIQGGYLDGVEKGDSFISPDGNVYIVKEVFDSASEVVYSIMNPSFPSVGEELRFYDNKTNPWQTRTLANESRFQKFKIAETLRRPADPSVTQKVNGVCKGRKLGFFERIMVNIMSFYGLWRYEHLYDSDFSSNQYASIQSNQYYKVAIVGSGVYPQEKELRNYIEASGFDFLSWDRRPADSLGMGTAAALYLKKRTKKRNYKIIPIRVLGAKGETHSSAIYSSFEWLSKRDDIKMVTVPFYPAVYSQAYRDGIQLLVNAGKIVVVPQSAGITNVHNAKARKSYRTKGLRTKVKLAGEGAGVMHLASDILNRSL